VQDRTATNASGIGNRRPEQISVTRGDGEGKAPDELIREAGVSALGILGRARGGPLRSLEMPCTENWAEALHAAAKCMCIGRQDDQNGNSGLITNDCFHSGH
jgi:hypothetical protein